MLSLLLPLGALVLAVLLVGVAALLTPPGSPTAGMGRGTRFFMVMLRLAIGWHFLFEAGEKFTTPTWSSEPYLREAVGPLAEPFHELAGDRVKEDMQVTYDGHGEPVFPERLALEWNAYLDQFRSYYGLTEQQEREALAKYTQAKDKTLKFLAVDTRPEKLSFPSAPPAEVQQTVAQRIQLFEAKLKEARDAEENDVPQYGPAGWAKVKEAKAEANRVRTGLKKDRDQQTAAMRDALRGVLDDQQKAKPAPEVSTQLPVVYVSAWSLLDWADFLVKWGLLFVGIFLMAGFLTRTACVAGALFLLTFYLAMPPLPGMPDLPRAEGHYLYVNKNIIEMLALLMLATTRSGRWAGLDGLLQFLRPRAWRSDYPARGRVLPQVHAAPRGAPTSATPSEEIMHGS
jgi:uncharacterized membrane protein YphA (DoxX/SURF4 family)